jgi:hypothetical protein
LEDTRVVVDGRPEDSDGKSAAGRRAIALDPYTVKHLARYVAKIEHEAAAHGRPAAYEYLAVGPTGERMHPDTLTAASTDSWTAPAFQESDCTMFGTRTRQWRWTPGSIRSC